MAVLDVVWLMIRTAAVDVVDYSVLSAQRSHGMFRIVLKNRHRLIREGVTTQAFDTH